jgi:hypothetical protein
MKVKGINGKEYTWNLSSYDVFYDDTRKRSRFHLRARNLLKETFNSYRILEEVKLPGSTAVNRRSVLYLDFYVPSLNLAVEVHGKQHYEFCSFFHKSRADFIKGQSRDEDKIAWCELNNIDIVTLKYSESDDEWRKQITNCV